MSYPNPTQLFFTASLAVFLIFVSTFGDEQPQHSLLDAQGNNPTLDFSAEDLINLPYDQGPTQSLAISLLTIDRLFSDAGNLAETACTTNYPGSHAFSEIVVGTLETQDVWLFANPANLALPVFDIIKGNLLLSTLSVENLGQRRNTLLATRGAELDIYGLGQQMIDPGVTEID